MTDTDIIEQDVKIRSLIEQQKYPEALKEANKWVAEEPNSDAAYFIRGFANLMWGQLEEAAVDVKKAISIEPSTAKYYNALGNIYFDMGNDEGAHGEFSRALHIEPDNLQYSSSLCKAKMNLGEIDDALVQVEGMYRTNTDDAIRDNLADIYSIAATKDWYHLKEDNLNYALTHEHIQNAEQYSSKARALSTTNPHVLTRLDDLDSAIKISKKRKFTGGWGALIVALIFAMFMFQREDAILYAYGISALLYYYALRTPQYVLNHLNFAGKDNLSLGDRIASVFVCDGWTFYGYGYGDAMMSMAKTNLFFGVIRAAIRLVLLPITVITALFNNYSKNHAFSIVGGMIGTIIILLVV